MNYFLELPIIEPFALGKKPKQNKKVIKEVWTYWREFTKGS